MACCNSQSNYSVKVNLIDTKIKKEMKHKLMNVSPPNSSSDNNKGNNNNENNSIPNGNKKPATSAVVTHC